MDQQRHFLPDFLIIPYQLIADDRIDPLDEKVYGVLYWLEHLKGGDCNPTNDEIANVVHANAETGARSIQNSLTKLETLGYITREYEDPETRRTRKAMHTNVAFRHMGQMVSPKASSKAVQVATESAETPREFAKRFFSGDREALAEIGRKLVEETGIDREVLYREIGKFISYWTEPNGSGMKQLWQTKPTFEIRRRLATWLSKVSSNRARRGAVL